MRSYFLKRYTAFQHKDFLYFWTGQAISNTGTQMQIVALNWHIYELTHSPIALGMIGLTRFVPIVIFSLLGGVLADAINRKKLMLLTQSAMAIFSLILALFTYVQHITPFWIFVLTALATISASFDGPARQAITPSLVPREHLTNAISLNTIMLQTTTIAGPAIAGVAIAQFGVGSVYLLNAVSFFAIIFALVNLKTTGEIQGEKIAVSIQSITEGLRFVKSRTIIWSTMLLDFFSTFFASATALLPIFAKDILRVGPEGLGFLYAAQAIGALLASFIMAHIGEIRSQGKVLLWAVAFYAVGTIIFGISKTFYLSIFGLMIIGAGDSVSTIIRNTIRQIATPDAIRGRMTSVNMIFFMGGPQLGEFEAGLLAAAVGGPLSVVIGGAATLIVVGIMAVKIPVLRKFDTQAT